MSQETIVAIVIAIIGSGGIVDQVPAPIRDDVKTALGAKEEEPAEPDAGTGE